MEFSIENFLRKHVVAYTDPVTPLENKKMILKATFRDIVYQNVVSEALAVKADNVEEARNKVNKFLKQLNIREKKTTVGIPYPDLIAFDKADVIPENMLVI